MEKKITLLEALTGTNFEVKHLDGNKMKVIFFIIFNTNKIETYKLIFFKIN